MTARRPPADLVGRGRGRAFWAEVYRQYDELGPHEIELLSEVCRCLDLVDALAREVRKAGLVVDGDAGPRPNPLLVELRLQRESLRHLMRSLNLPGDDDETWTSKRAKTAAEARWSK